MYPGYPVENWVQPIQGYPYPPPGYNQAQMPPNNSANPAPLPGYSRGQMPAQDSAYPSSSPGYNHGQMPPNNNAYVTLPVPAGYESLTTANINQSSQMKI